MIRIFWGTKNDILLCLFLCVNKSCLKNSARSYNACVILHFIALLYVLYLFIFSGALQQNKVLDLLHFVGQWANYISISHYLCNEKIIIWKHSSTKLWVQFCHGKSKRGHGKDSWENKGLKIKTTLWTNELLLILTFI